ncbi:MAG: adenylosuccinate synthetase, partial [Candidatus Veblenbacteria bacterium]|nr:adenylosuccinate synthetase [Candidatus Veblenbacteria bacterium]
MSTARWQTMVILGAQWGDEGKGKVTDYYGSQADYVVRFQGGNNAGHTIVYRGQVLKLHLLPSGVLHKRCITVIGNGVVLDPRVLFEELAQLKKLGVVPRLMISERAHIIFPFHISMDDVSEGAFKKKNLAALSTKRGIWPTYADKMARVGVRVVDLLNRELFRRKFDLLYDVQLRKLRILYNFRGRLRPKEVIFQGYLKKGRRLKPYVADVS